MAGGSVNTPGDRDTSEQWFSRARQLMPGGVNSPVRAFRSVGGTPRFIRRAAGCRMTDVDGRTYIDYVGSWGPMILGHAAPAVLAEIEEALRRGTSFGAPSPLEVELAEEIRSRVPSVERIRMVNSGTEAAMSALRVARAGTGRDKVVKFTGCYHGHADAMLVKAGSGVAALGLPDSPGVPAGATETTLTVPFNDLSAVGEVFALAGPQIAAVIVEPVAGNMGVVPPDDGFLQGLRRITIDHGALLIFDEVMTGFRVARGGAQARYDVRPDLTTFGKVIGGGLPVGAYGGRADLMDQVAPAGPVYQAGTLSGNPLTMAAGLATLRRLDDEAYARLEVTSVRLEAGLRRVLAEAGVRATVQRVGSMLTVFFGTTGVRNFADASRANHGQFAAFFHGMLRQGVHLPPSGFEAWFVSLAHDFDAIDATIEHARTALRDLPTTGSDH